MRIVINERRIKRNRQVAQVLFFLSIAILLAGLVASSGLIPAAQSGLLFLAPLVVMPVGLFTTILSIRLTNLYVRPPHAEDAINDGLKGFNKQSILYHYVFPGAEHVLVSPLGVFSLVTRFHETKFKVQEGYWINEKGRGPLAPIFIWLKQEGIGKPFKQADDEAALIQKLVDEALPDAKIEVQSIIVFTSDKAVLELIDPEIPVVYANAKKKPSLKGQIRDFREEKKDKPAILTNQQIDTLHNKILTAAGATSQESALVETEA